MAALHHSHPNRPPGSLLTRCGSRHGLPVSGTAVSLAHLSLVFRSPEPAWTDSQPTSVPIHDANLQCSRTEREPDVRSWQVAHTIHVSHESWIQTKFLTVGLRLERFAKVPYFYYFTKNILQEAS